MLRKITEKDLTFARRLRNKNRNYFFDSRKVDELTHHAWFTASQLDPDFHFYIIWEKEDRVGTISAHDNGEVIEIGNVLIDENHRKKGYCRKAIRELLELHRRRALLLSIHLSTQERPCWRPNFTDVELLRLTSILSTRK